MTDALAASGPPRLRSAFGTVGKEPAEKGKGRSPRITLRLTKDEQVRLKRLASGTSISAYVRGQVFSGSAAPRRRHPRVPVKDQEALAQVLALLGRSHMASNLNQIARQANCGALVMDEEIEGEIKMACARIAWIRVKLIEALGLKAGDGR